MIFVVNKFLVLFAQNPIGTCLITPSLILMNIRNRLTAYRTIFNAAPASGTKIHIYAACTLFDLYFEIPGRAFDRFKISIGDKFDI